MPAITCPQRSMIGEQPVCQVVAQLTDRPLAECHVNDSACAFCLGCPIAPQGPNVVTASMAIGVAQRSGDEQFWRYMLNAMRPHLKQSPAPPQATAETHPCIKRGRVVRQQECKPCQQNGTGPLVDVFACHEFGECTLNNTGTTPKIQGCATCGKRLEQSYQLTHTNPPEVLAAIATM